LLLLGYASYIVELLDRFTYEEGENRVLYQLLVDSLERVSTLPDPFSAVRYFTRPVYQPGFNWLLSTEWTLSASTC